MTRYAAGWRFCTSCQVTRPEEGGVWIKRPPHVHRWKCSTCVKKSKEWYDLRRAAPSEPTLAASTGQ